MISNMISRRVKKSSNVPFGSLNLVPAPKSANDAENVENVQNANGQNGTPQAVASVVVTISSSASYDDLFENIPQTSEFGRIVVYKVSPGKIFNLILRALQGEDIQTIREDGFSEAQKDVLQQFATNCVEAGPEAVCFNFECCGFYDSAHFGDSTDLKDLHLDLIGYLVREFGCLCMFSDFSLKALISDWDSNRLGRGPNPFVQVGEFSGKFSIAFDPDQLKNCHSAQLVTVGSLCDDKSGNHKATATVAAMPSTILYTLSEAAISPNVPKDYVIEVLTVAEMVSNEAYTRNKMNDVLNNAASFSWKPVQCELANQSKGFAGHVMITYPASEQNIAKFNAEEDKEDGEEPPKGMILASCGHWVELMKIDANLARLLETVRNDWGEQDPVYEQMNARMLNMDSDELEEEVQATSKAYVASRAPAKYNRKLVKAKKKNL